VTPRVAPGAILVERFQVDVFVAPTPYGELYRGRDNTDGKMVALQLFTPEWTPSRSILDGKVQLAAHLDHKNIAAVYGLFATAVAGTETLLLVSEWVDGQSLRDMLEKKRGQGRGLSVKSAYNIMAHLCNALTYSHGATAHGGLGADNVWVNAAGRVKVLDFWFAGLQQPAQTAEDVVAIGHVLYLLLTAEDPSDRPMSQVVPGLPVAVDQVYSDAITGRLPDPAAFKEALQVALAGELEGVARPTGAVPIKASVPKAAPAKAAPASPAKPAPPPKPATAKSAPPAPPPASPRAPAAPASPMSKPSDPAPRAQPKGFSVDAAMSSFDVESERWLIQKDKLDFGPFNLRDVQAQVEAGKILADHTIIDTETGERRRVKDHPALRQIVTEAESKLADKQREASEAAERKSARGRILVLLAGILVVLAGAGGGILYYLNQKPKIEKVIVHDQNNDLDFLKGLEISMKVDPPAPKKPVGKKRTGGKNEFSDVTNLGDASEGGGGDETLDQSVVQRVMTQNFKVLLGCIGEERKRNASLKNIEMDFIIKGTGAVGGVKVNGATGTPLANCMYAKMQSVAFPKFNGSKTHASFSLNLK